MSYLREIHAWVHDGVGNIIESVQNALKVSLHDGEGNPLSSYYDLATQSYVLNIHDADVHARPVNQYFHQHTGNDTTLAVATAVNDYVINVVTTAGLVVGDYIQIDEENHQGIKYQITALTATTMTLDTYIDAVFPIGTAVRQVEIEMSVIGSMTSPQSFKMRPNTNQVIHVTRILITMTHGSAGDLGLFGNLAPLLNGVQLRANVNGQYGTFTNWTTNEKIKADMYDVAFDTRSSGGGTYGTSGRGSFDRIGVAVRLDGRDGAVDGDYIEVIIKDDLTGLISFEVKAQGHIEGE